MGPLNVPLVVLLQVMPPTRPTVALIVGATKITTAVTLTLSKKSVTLLQYSYSWHGLPIAIIINIDLVFVSYQSLGQSSYSVFIIWWSLFCFDLIK